MVILGVDPSLTSTGLCNLVTNSHAVKEIETHSIVPERGPSDYDERFTRYYELVNQIIRHVRPDTDLVVIEGYSFGSRGRAVYNLAEFGGILRDRLIKTKFPILDVAPTRLKKFVLKGNASKEDVHERLKDVESIFEAIHQEDELDACTAALFGFQFLNNLDQQKEMYKQLDYSCIYDTIERVKGEVEKVKDQHRAWNIGTLI